MTYKIRISPKAQDDLAEIKSYISQELCNPQAATKLVSKIMKRIRGLSEFPEMGATLSSVIDIHTEYRFLVCGNYLVFYRLEDGNVFVSRVIYGKRNYMRILFGSLTVNGH